MTKGLSCNLWHWVPPPRLEPSFYCFIVKTPGLHLHRVYKKIYLEKAEIRSFCLYCKDIVEILVLG